MTDRRPRTRSRTRTEEVPRRRTTTRIRAVREVGGHTGSLLGEDAESLLHAWTEQDRGKLEELFQDAGSDLKRELLRRAVLAEHTLETLGPFADALISLPDQEAYEACAPGWTQPSHDEVAKRLRLELDPIRAFATRALCAPAKTAAKTRTLGDADEGSKIGRSGVQKAPSAARELGASSSALTGRHVVRDMGERTLPPASPQPRGFPLRVLNEAVSALAVRYQEHLLDTGGMSTVRALELAADALGRGVPLPAQLGRKPGDRGARVILLQVQQAGTQRAFQLHDPFADETVWVNERDLLAGLELPFSGKRWRRLSVIALPDSKGM